MSKKNELIKSMTLVISPRLRFLVAIEKTVNMMVN